MTGLKAMMLTGMLVGVVAAGVAIHTSEDGTLGAPCAKNSEQAAAVHAILMRGLDDALHRQVESLFIVWMKDDTDQPRRAANGVRQAIAAYLHAGARFESFEIPICGQKP